MSGAQLTPEQVKESNWPVALKRKLLKDMEKHGVKVAVAVEPSKPKKSAKPGKVGAPPTPEAYAEAEEEQAAKKLEGLMSGYIEEILPEQAEILRKGATESFCMPPSVKERLTRELKGRVSKKVDAIQSKREREEYVGKDEADLVMALFTLGEDVKRIPACEPSEVEDMFETVMEVYPESADLTFDELVDKLSMEKTAAAEKRSTKVAEALEEKTTAGTALVLEEKGIQPHKATSAQKAAAKAEARERVLISAPTRSQDQLISGWHNDIYMSLHGYLYDGVKGQKTKQLPSPCGLHIPMGDDAIGKSEDILAFFGSKDDWKDFYIEGEEGVEKGDTFRRLHKDDWPGCIKDLFFGNKFVTDDELKKLISDVNKRHKLKLAKKDFVDVGELPQGYGY